MVTKKQMEEWVHNEAVLRINILPDLSAVVTDNKGRLVRHTVDKKGGPPGVHVTGNLPTATWGDGNSICVWHHGRMY